MTGNSRAAESARAIRSLATVSPFAREAVDSRHGFPPGISGGDAAVPLSHEAIAAGAASALNRPAPAILVDRVSELTGGLPRLVALVLRALQADGGTGDSGMLDPQPAIDALAAELTGMDDGVPELLLALAVGFDLSGPVPAYLTRVDGSVDDLVARACAAGLLPGDGCLVPLVRHAVLETVPAYRVRALQRVLVDTLVAEGRPLDEVARGLARSGLKDRRVADALEHAGDVALPTAPVLAAALYDEAGAAGADPLATAARRAQAASATGDLDAAARILDGLFAHPDPPDVLRGVDVASAVWARRGMLSRSAELYRWLGPARVGPSAELAAIAMIGAGDKVGAEGMFEVARGAEGGTPSLLTVATTLMAQGIRDSIADRTAPALPALIRASDMMTASGLTAPLPEIPAVLAALVALHSGHLDVAESVIDSALAGGQCGPAAGPRLLLLRAWAAMQRDRPALARGAIDQATAGEVSLGPRDEMLLCALEVGIARRADDAAALVRGWQRARQAVLHVPVDLYSIIPLGELLIAATRLRDSEPLETHLSEAWELLSRLGNPPLWSVSLHWCGVQAAILNERPGELAPHAAALVRASTHSHLAAVLATAGRAWVSVLAGDFEVAAVESAARGLASVGLTWDGSRLAGHAAPRAEERRDMARLLACARDLHPSGSGVARAATAPTGPVPATVVGVAGARDASGLSAREREVARLVLEGKTYGEIGESIFISPRTVEHHVARIRRRLGAATRSELLAQLRLALDETGDPQA